MSKFRWMYVGSGNIAKSTASSIKKGNHSITAVYGRNPERVKKFADKYGAKAYNSFDEAVMSSDVDAVYIATPHTSHLEYAKRAMALGKPVLCEKPVAVCEKDVIDLINCARDNNVYFSEAMWTWFSDVALTVKKWIADGEIGEVRNVEIYYSFPGIMMPKTSRVLTPETAGGALLDIGIYPITYCYNLFGYPNSIECNGELKNGIDIKETIILGYDGFRCTLKMSLTELKESCHIIGTKGSISLPMFHMASKAGLKTEEMHRTFRGKTDYLTEFTRVSEEILGGKTESSYIPYKATQDCMRIMDECRKQMNLVYPFE